MKRSELLRSSEYWTTEIQLQVFSLIENFRTKNNLTKTEIARKLNVSKGYITQILNGDFDHKISKLVQLALAFDKVPIVHFVDAEKYISDDADGMKAIYQQDFKPVQYNTFRLQSDENKAYSISSTPMGRNIMNIIPDLYKTTIADAPDR